MSMPIKANPDVSWRNAGGRILAEMACPCPHGIPVITPVFYETQRTYFLRQAGIERSF
jgi:arginine/lysine/ornithine decarboxylase